MTTAICKNGHLEFTMKLDFLKPDFYFNSLILIIHLFKTNYQLNLFRNILHLYYKTDTGWAEGIDSL